MKRKILILGITVSLSMVGGVGCGIKNIEIPQGEVSTSTRTDMSQDGKSKGSVLDSGIISNDVKTQAKELDNKQLVVPSIKEISVGTLGYIRGWYGKDSILTATDIDSPDLVVKNLETGADRKVAINELKNGSAGIDDYQNKKLLLSKSGKYYLYDMETGKSRSLCNIGTLTMIPKKFIDPKGDYIITDNGHNFILVKTDNSQIINFTCLKMSDFMQKSGMQFYPDITISDDKETVYYTKDNSIYKTSIKSPETSSLFYTFAQYPKIHDIKVIKGEGSIFGFGYTIASDTTYEDHPFFFNLSTKKETELKNYHFGSYADCTSNVESSFVNKIIYDQTDTKAGLPEIFVGQIKGDSIVKARNIMSKEMSKAVTKDNANLSTGLYGIWNEDATKVFVTTYKEQGNPVWRHFVVDVQE